MKNPTEPRIGEAYNSQDSITGVSDWTAAEKQNRVSETSINFYSSLTAGNTTEGTRQGTIFGYLNAAGTTFIALYKKTGTAVSIK
jgi:hypothetical protein